MPSSLLSLTFSWQRGRGWLCLLSHFLPVSLGSIQVETQTAFVEQLPFTYRLTFTPLEARLPQG